MASRVPHWAWRTAVPALKKGKAVTPTEHSVESTYVDDYSQYEEIYNPPSPAELAWRRGQFVGRRRPDKLDSHAQAQELADTEGLERGFETTYTPGQFEERWLLSSLRAFYDEQLIDDVLAIIKGGKEANVYRCKAHPTTGLGLLAAKVYRPRMFRNLRNDKIYREGRTLLTEEGNPVKRRDHRLARAVGKKTGFGVQVEHTSWLMYEYTTLQRIHAAGGAVPRPTGVSENAILMEYVGDEHLAAPTLNTVELDLAEAHRLYDEVLRNVELMLRHNLIHGDLSAYNILYWRGEITLIDFPQVVDSRGNDSARAILRRDLGRVCEYFRSQGVACDPDSVMGDLWGRHVGSKLREQLADYSMWEYRHAEDDEEIEEGVE